MTIRQAYIKDTEVDAWLSQKKKDGGWNFSKFVTESARAAMVNEEMYLEQEEARHLTEAKRLAIRRAALREERVNRLKNLRRELESAEKTRGSIADPVLRNAKENTIQMLKYQIGMLDRDTPRGEVRGGDEHGKR
jgi:hypothetical protein